MSDTAFVIGNGTSRKPIDLADLKKAGKIYGCNALYRTFTPDVLFATDDEISIEIQNSGYPLTNLFYTRYPLPNTGAKVIDLRWGWSSGPIALTYASIEKFKTIYLLGFDLSGLAGKFNNMYADTPCYKKSTDVATFYGNWVNQCIITMKEFNNIQYIRVISKDSIIPAEFKQVGNLTHTSVEEFSKCINI